MSNLIERIREKVNDLKVAYANGQYGDVDNCYWPMPPVSDEDVIDAERSLGFQLPPLVRQLYTQVGNGGFGPIYGLIVLSEKSRASLTPEVIPPEAEFNLVEKYHALVECYKNEGDGWPDRLLPLFYCGCSTFEYVDCVDDSYQVVDFDACEELSDLYERLSNETITLEDRLEAWLAGENIYQ